MLIWDVFYLECRKVRLAGFGAQAGKFRNINADRVITLRDRIFKDFNIFAGFCRHAKQDTRSGLLLARTHVRILADLD